MLRNTTDKYLNKSWSKSSSNSLIALQVLEHLSMIMNYKV
jgi:hypothetical protein